MSTDTPVLPSAVETVDKLTMALMVCCNDMIMPLHRQGFDEVACLSLIAAALANTLVTQTMMLDVTLGSREEEKLILSLVPQLFEGKRADLSRTPTTH